MILLANIAASPSFFVNPFLGLALLIPIILIETVVLHRMKWGSFWSALGVVLLANVVSTLVGIVIVQDAGYRNHFCDETTCGWTISVMLVLALMWLASVVIEGVVLLLWRRKDFAFVWKAALIANIASYVLLSPCFLFYLTLV